MRGINRSESFAGNVRQTPWPVLRLPLARDGPVAYARAFPRLGELVGDIDVVGAAAFVSESLQADQALIHRGGLAMPGGPFTMTG